MSNKFETLQPWLGEILTSINKDIRTDYLPGDTAFYRSYFGNRPQNRITSDEIHAAFADELLKGNESMAEWVVNHWVFKHGDLYAHFAEKLSGVTDDFSELTELTVAQSEEILEGADAFGQKELYLFSVLNDVVFPNEILAKLRETAQQVTERVAAYEKEEAERLDLAKMAERHQREMNRLTEKYEQKLAGVLKKYTSETNALKKQIQALQKGK